MQEERYQSQINQNFGTLCHTEVFDTFLRSQKNQTSSAVSNVLTLIKAKRYKFSCFHICKWIFLAILSFAKIEEMEKGEGRIDTLHRGVLSAQWPLSHSGGLILTSLG